jgi:dienelactone hydrolase
VRASRILFSAFIAAAALAPLSTPAAERAAADETVTFASARYLVGELQQRLTRERGETPRSAPVTTIQAYLSKPDGKGPFPAVVYLHGCGGLTAHARASTAGQMTGWGYVTLVVDSFATRGIKPACVWPEADQHADALGALLYLSTLSFVDARRVALVGHSQGGMAALEVASFHPFAMFEMPTELKYRAVVAFYPSCDAAEDELAIPALILIGELDEWAPIKLCEWWMQRRGGKGAPVKLVVYPQAYHGFDNTAVRGGMEFYFGHWLKYDADAAQRSAMEMHDFLTVQLGN